MRPMLSLPYPALEQIVQRIQAGNTLAHAENLVGGAAAHVVLLHVEDGHAEPRQYLLRMHGEADRTRNPHVASHEHRLLTVLHDSGLPVAKPYYLDESGELLPHPYIVVGYLEGATDFAPRNLADFLQQSAGLLARIHRLPALPRLGFLPDRHAHVRRWIDYQPAELDEALDEGPLRATLRAAFPPRPANHVTLLHGDFWPGNLIWREGRLAGVVDWEDAEIGDPLSDLSVARLDILWGFGRDAMHGFTQAYQAHMPQLDYRHLPHWDLMSALRPASQLEDWAAVWGRSGRPDVTATTMRQAHHWFVQQAREQMGRVA